MPLPPPVPSRMALHALQGLAFGTSATLIGLTLSSQMQRIGAAQGPAENARRIRAHKQRYHAKAGAGEDIFARVREDEGRDPDATASFSTLARPEASRDLLEELDLGSLDGLGFADQGTLAIGSLARSPFVLPRRLPLPKLSRLEETFFKPINPQYSAAELALLQPEPTKDEMMITVDGVDEVELPRRVRQLVDAGRPESIDKAGSLVESFLSTHPDLAALDDQWLQTTAVLVRALHHFGEVVRAATILQDIISRGPMEEDIFLAYGPFDIVEGLLAEVSAAAEGQEGRAVFKSRLRAAKDIFLARTTSRPRKNYEDLSRVAAVLLNASLSSRQLGQLDDIFRRVNPLRKGDFLFVGSYISTLHQHGESKTAVNRFIRVYSKTNPDRVSFASVGDTVVSAVETTGAYRASEVLGLLLNMSKRLQNTFRAAWFRRLLLAEWRRARDFSSTAELFTTLRAGVDTKLLDYPSHEYRPMIDICLEAGQVDLAQKYFEEFSATLQSPRDIVHVRGSRALHLAKSSDWVGVRQEFDAMSEALRSEPLAANTVFIPVLNEYAQSHGIAEIEEFVRVFVDSYEIEPSQRLVTTMTAQYCKKGDLASLGSWLAYARKSGYPIDNTVFNTILQACQKRWKMPFTDLQAIFSKAQLLDKDLVDDVTDRIMRKAALVESRDSGDPHIPKAGSPQGNPVQPGRTRQIPNPRAVYETMNSAAVGGSQDAILAIYKEARRNGMAPCTHCLRLIAQVSAKDSSSREETLKLLRKEAECGANLTAAVVPLFKYDLDQIATSHTENTLVEVSGMLRQYESQGIKLSDTTFNQIAWVCLKQGHIDEAISYCEQAAARSGNSLGYNMFNFNVLVGAYAQHLDVEGLRSMLLRLVESDFCAESLPLEQLRNTQDWLGKRTIESDALDKAKELVELGVRYVTAKMEDLQSGQVEIQAQIEGMLGEFIRRGQPRPGKS